MARPARACAQVEDEPPCRRCRRRVDGPWLYRVPVFDRRIALECSHVLTDGRSALMVLHARREAYLERRGVATAAAEGPAGEGAVPRPGHAPHPDEAEDAYRRFHEPRLPLPPGGDRAVRLRGDPVGPGELHVATGIVALAPLRAASRTHGVSLTELLVGVLLAAVLDIVEDARRPIMV